MKFVGIFGLVAMIAGPLVAADLEQGQKLARKCSVCHGKQGLARDPEVPNLAGQSAYYLEKALKDYRDGMREDRRMTLIVKPLSNEDIKDLSAWFESFEIVIIKSEDG